MIRKLFLDHPHSIGESYWEHMGNALKIGAYLCIFCIVPVIIHALVPYFFTVTTSDHIFTLATDLKKRRRLPLDT